MYCSWYFHWQQGCWSCQSSLFGLIQIRILQQKSTEKKLSINVNCLINLQNSLIRYFIYGFQCNIHYLKISIHIYGTVLLNPDPILTGAESDLGQTRNRSVLRDHILIQSWSTQSGRNPKHFSLYMTVYYFIQNALRELLERARDKIQCLSDGERCHHHWNYITQQDHPLSHCSTANKEVR
jgi:hypothetical protein